jgi:hypothetical protein
MNYEEVCYDELRIVDLHGRKAMIVNLLMYLKDEG